MINLAQDTNKWQYVVIKVQGIFGFREMWEVS